MLTHIKLLSKRFFQQLYIFLTFIFLICFFFTSNVFADEFGHVSAQFESGNDPCKVSTGAGDAGGVSYGRHQFASKVGIMSDFLNTDGSSFKSKFNGTAPGSNEFTNIFKQICKDPNFIKATIQYVKRVHWGKVQKCSTFSKYNTSNAAITEALFSMGIQHGGVCSIMQTANSKIKDHNNISDVIKQLYKARGDYIIGNGVQNAQSIINNRYAQEQQMLAKLAGVQIDSAYDGTITPTSSNDVTPYQPITVSSGPVFKAEEITNIVWDGEFVENKANDPKMAGQICSEFNDGNLPEKAVIAKKGTETLVKKQYYETQKQLADQAASCIACKEVLKKSYITSKSFYKLFNIGNFIPVVPSACKPPQPISLMIFQILRVYAFIASLALYLIILALIIIAVKWTVGGVSTNSNMGNIKKSATNLVFALVIILTISTLVMELLRAVGVNENSLNIKGD